MPNEVTPAADEDDIIHHPHDTHALFERHADAWQSIGLFVAHHPHVDALYSNDNTTETIHVDHRDESILLHATQQVIGSR
jgi:hypothetical protein